MKRQRPINETRDQGHGCLANGRCYRWTWEVATGRFFFRGPGMSRNHQPGPRHPVWGLVEEWKRTRGERHAS